MTFGEKLFKLRKEKGLSQEQLAEQMNTTRQAVSKWENDQGFPETEKRSALAVTSRQWQPVTDFSKVMKISPPQPSQERIHSGRVSKEFRFF